MKAYVYRSDRRADTYVYLRERDAFGLLPAPLRERLGTLAFALEVELAPGRQLARVDIDAVRAALQLNGFFLQLPPSHDADIGKP
jgi:uncharacterized protein YcgL (UPF0745 family)